MQRDESIFSDAAGSVNEGPYATNSSGGEVSYTLQGPDATFATYQPFSASHDSQSVGDISIATGDFAPPTFSPSTFSSTMIPEPFTTIPLGADASLFEPMMPDEPIIVRIPSPPVMFVQRRVKAAKCDFNANLLRLRLLIHHGVQSDVAPIVIEEQPVFAPVPADRPLLPPIAEEPVTPTAVSDQPIVSPLVETTHSRTSSWSSDAYGPQPLLHVFGDSFVGPFTLFQGPEVRVTKFKGASAQGLANPLSALQVGPQLAEKLRDYITAPGSHRRSAMLMFGSVDMHINYLNHVTSTSIVRHLPLHERKGSTVPFDDQAMTGIEYAQKSFEAYAKYLFRFVVRSEIGDYIRARAETDDPAPPIMIAAAAPPMVQDRYLEAIRLKYILPHQSKPKDWAEPKDWADQSRSSSTSSSPERSTSSSACTTPPRTPTKATVDMPLSVRAIIDRDLGLLDLANRIDATRFFNAELQDFCESHPDILRFVDITPDMVDPHAIIQYDVDRSRFGDKADGTNVHVDWEATLPLWMKTLGANGVAVDQFRLKVSLEETARAFNAEKSERVKRRTWRLESDESIGQAKDVEAPKLSPQTKQESQSMDRYAKYQPSRARDDGPYRPPHKHAMVRDVPAWRVRQGSNATGSASQSLQSAMRFPPVSRDVKW